MPFEVEVTLGIGGECAKTRNTKIRKWGGYGWARFFSLFKEYSLQRLQKQAGGVHRRGGGEAAAKNGYHERSDKENQIERKDGCQKSLAGRGVACGGL